MPARLKLTVDWFNKKLIKSNSNSAPYTLPKFYQGDVVPFFIQVVEPDPNGGPNDYVVVDLSSAALKFAVSDTPTGSAGGPSPFVAQTSWTYDTVNQGFTATVAFNTAALNTYLGSSRTASPWMELEITEIISGTSAITTIWQGQITLDAEINEVSTLTVPAGSTPLSLEIASQLFAKKIMEAGETLTFTSPDGNSLRILGVRNDKSGQDDVL